MSSQLTLAEAATELGVDMAEIRRLVALGRLDHQQICSGRCELVVSRESVQALRSAGTA